MTQTRISEAELVEIGQRADRLHRDSIDDEAEPTYQLAIAVAADVERLLEIVRQSV